MATGGSYMSMPLSSSLAVKMCMTSVDPDPYARSLFQAGAHYSTYEKQCASLGRSRPRSAPQYGNKYIPSPTMDHYYHATPMHREFTTTEYRTIYSPAQPLSQRRQMSAPYPNRTVQTYKNVAIGRPSVDIGGGAPSLPLPKYDALHDPHLQEYFTRRFTNIPSSKSIRKKGKGSIQSKKSPRGKSSSSQGLKETTYKVAITTGPQKNCGTDAKVCLRMKGSKGKMPKKCLSKYRTGKKSSAQGKSKRLVFVPGTTQLFKIQTEDIGMLKSITLEHDGLTEKDAWFVETVEVTNLRTEKTWLFNCHQWLSLHHTDCQISRTLYHQLSAKTEYEIVVVTGDKRNAGTDAHVFITIYGKSGQTEKLPLISKSKDLFRANSSDIFHVKANCVGPLTKIRIEHDNSGTAPGWYLERVVVTDRTHPSWKYYFPCGQWLAKDEGDGAICRDLIGSKDPLAMRKSNKYKVTVYTGKVKGGGTDANVYLTMFGQEGDSAERKLDNNKNNFEAGQVDEFILECACLGTLSRIRIGHDNKGSSPGWFLDKVIIDDMEQQRVYEFPCHRWLALDEDDGQISRDLYCGIGANDAAPGIPYKIQVKTGNLPNAGTSARVYIVLYGGKDGNRTSGKIWLEKGKFERGRTDEFSVEVAEALSPLSRIDIGHDNSGPGPGWFLHQVVVGCPSAGIEQTFLCDKWFALDEGDGLIERTLTEQLSLRKQQAAKITWFTWVHTSDLRGAGTDANVYIVVYGDKGKSDDIKLDNETNNFEAGSVDQFKIEITDVGKPFKIRIWHDDSKPASAWHLDRVEMENMLTKERFMYICKRWLAHDEDDGSIIREIPAEGPGIKSPLPLVKYIAEVHTGKKMGAGTDANVFLNVFGLLGDTGERPLEASQSNTNKFERGNVDVFTFEAVTLKQLSKIRIGHDGKNAGAGWFLDKVVIKQEGTDKYDKTFLCNRWLAVDEDDGLIVREITSGGSQLLSTTSYIVSIKTGDVSGAGTDANAYLKIFGEKGDTGVLQLKSSANTKDKFERARTDKFPLEATDIGKISRIRIGHDGSGPGAGWFIDDINIDVPSRGESYRFALHRWLAVDEEDGKIEIELEPTDVTAKEKSIPYEITVWTSDVKGAGTDANVFIQMYGEDGKSEEYKIGNKTDNFEQGQVDKFKIEAKDVGPLVKVRVGHDGAGMFAGWHLDKILIQRYPSNKSKRRKTVNTKRKKAARESDEEVDSDSIATTKKSKGTLKKTKSKAKIDDDHDQDDQKAELLKTEDYWFLCRRWFAKNEEDGKIVRELIATDENGKPLDGGLEEVSYTMKVKTGDVRGAGTDANVFVILTGDKGDSGERHLTDSDKINKFEQGQEDVFILTAVDLGNLKKLKIWHDNKGGGAAWFLDYVEVEDPRAKKSYFFPCQRWLATDEDDRQISRTLVPVDKSLKDKQNRKGSSSVLKEIALETKAALQTYHVYVTTGDKFGAGTDANVHLILFGENDDTGFIPLKATVNGNSNKFERNQTDEFVVETAEIGDLKKIRIGHDNAGGGADWFLDRVEIDCPAIGKRWLFPCQRWLGKDKDDGALERDLFPQDLDTVEYTPCIPYEITVVTSDKRGADTGANPYIQLYGTEMCSQKKDLCSSKDQKKRCFKRGQTDVFILELEDVGDTIEKIRIGHDGSGLGAGWHLSSVSIRKLHASGKGSITYVFPCDRWLARDEEDGAIERELVPSNIKEERTKKDGKVEVKEKKVKDQLITKKYTVNVYTGDMAGGGTDANVFLTLFGEKGDSGERKLHKSETHKDKFERNQVDVFLQEIVDLGKIYKCKIRHDNSLLNADWYLDRIEVQDTIDNEMYIFHCERWLGKKKDDGKIERTLYVKGYDGDMTSSTGTMKSLSKYGGSSLSLDSAGSDQTAKLTKRQSQILENTPTGPTISYTVKIRTGDGEDNGTESHAWVRIIGSKKKDTGKMYLDLIGKKKFEPGSMETFSLDGIDVGEVKQLEIGHDGTTPGSGWLVKEVELDVPSKGKHFIFSCKQWLAKDKSDGKISRLLSVQDGQSSVSQYKPMIPYEVTFYTGDVQNAGTDALVKLTAFGEGGSSSEAIIEKKGERFERGRADLVKLDLDDIAPIRKIRVSHDGKSSRPSWFLEKVEMRNMDTGDLSVFEANTWLSKTQGDGKLSMDFPAKVRGKQILKTTSYKVTVKTSDERGAGTDANVYVCLFGENGDSGEIHLKESETNKSPFENNQEDVFTIQDVLSLGVLTKCRVWHDNKGIGAAWHCAWIEVEDLKMKKKYMFPCNRWLSKSDDDKQIVRELTCSSAPDKLKKGDKISYEITISTSDKKDASMIHNAWLILEGEKSKSKEFVMKNSAVQKVFRKGNSDTFTMECRFLGKLKRCILGAVQREDKPLGAKSGSAAKWHCYEVKVSEGSSGSKYTFPCNKWIEIADDVDPNMAVILKVDEEKIEESKVLTTRSLAPVKYEVLVMTGDVTGAGTNANVSITVFGENGDTGKRELKQKFKDLFERKQTDKFEIEALDLGELTKIRIEHDNAGFRPGWFLDRVEITNMATSKKYMFPCEQWLDKDKGDKQIFKELYPRD